MTLSNVIYLVGLSLIIIGMIIVIVARSKMSRLARNRSSEDLYLEKLNAATLASATTPTHTAQRRAPLDQRKVQLSRIDRALHALIESKSH